MASTMNHNIPDLHPTRDLCCMALHISLSPLISCHLSIKLKENVLNGQNIISNKEAYCKTLWGQHELY